MRLASTHVTVPRIWTVELRPRASGPTLDCPRCTRSPAVPGSTARSAALHHLARHARSDALPGHLRTCQCRAHSCRWHPRHRGCSGPVLLALTSIRNGRSWRLADVCAACAASMRHTAVVPATLLSPGRTHAPPGTSGSAHRASTFGPQEQRRVREMLTYLATALPRYTSPCARLLALQCALRTDRRGRVCLAPGFLRGIRLHGRTELWHELEHASWLRPIAPKYSAVEVQLLDAAVLHQAPGRAARLRAAQWALRSVPLAASSACPPAVRLTALALAAHTDAGVGGVDLDTLTDQCGQSPRQLEDLLDRLVRIRLLAAWYRQRDGDEVRWELPACRPSSSTAPLRTPQPGRH